MTKLTMIHIIDANNLAGKIGLLGQKDFDRLLITRLKDYYRDKKIKVVLVFDGVDFMGDKAKDNNLEIIYAPKDGYYKSADDKIIELALDENLSFRDEIAIYTDDREIVEKINKQNKAGRKINFHKASTLAENMEARIMAIDDEEEEDRFLNENEIKNINDELLKLWSGKK